MGNEDCDHSEDASLQSSSIISWSIELFFNFFLKGGGLITQWNFAQLCRALSFIAFTIPLAEKALHPGISCN